MLYLRTGVTSILQQSTVLAIFLLCNRHSILPTDIRCNLTDNEENKSPYDYNTFQSVPHPVLSIRKATHDQDSCDIKTAQAKQQGDYNRHHSSLSSTPNVGFKVLLQNQKRKYRKSGKLS